MSSGSIRIIQLPEKSSVNTDDYMAVDSSANGTKKVKFTDLLDDNLSAQNKAADAQATGQAISELNTDINNTNTRIDNMINTQQNAEVTTLWTGTLNTIGGSVTLSKSVSNFDFLDFYTSNGTFERVPVSAGTLKICETNIDDNGLSAFQQTGEATITFSGTTVTLTSAYIWDYASTGTVTISAGIVSNIKRIDGVKIGHIENDEIIDARVGANGTTYPTLGDAIRGQVTDLKADFNQITGTSVNLFNPTTVISGINISSGGAETVSATSHVSDYIAVEGGETYVFSKRPNSSYYYYLATYDSSKTFIERINVYQYDPIVTLGSTVAYVRFSVYQNDFVDDFMFVKGLALPSNYIPYYNVDEDALPVISGKVNAIIEKSPNLFDISAITTGKYQNAGGSLVNEASSAISDYIPVEGGQKYTNNGDNNYWYIGTFDKNGTFIERLNAYNLASTITLGATVAYVRISVYQHDFDNNFMFVKGETLPDKYKPYGYILKDSALTSISDAVVVTKVSNTELTIATGKGRHTLKHQTDADKHLDTWRLTRGTANGKILWNDVDVECPIKEKDASDFMGGYHGDEVFTDAVFLIDGEDTDITTVANGTVINCQNFTACITSDIYYDGDSVNKAFVRNKRLVFEDNKVQIYNTYKFIGTTIQIDIATGCGLYPVSSNYVNGYSTNTGNAYISEATTNRNRYLDRVSFYGDEFTLNLKVLFGKGDAYYGVVYYYPDQTRYKAYFYQHYTVGSNYLTLNNGDELYSGYEIAFV